MKQPHVSLPFLAAVLAALCLLSACTDRVGRVRSALEAADSLMMTAPEAALDTLYGIDSISIGKLDRSGVALYTLLRTEAEYKCYLPVAEDTAVFEAADYYRDRPDEDMYYARALIMSGSVRQERSELNLALQAYKEAEPILERLGNLEQLGLLNTRMGSLFQSSFVDIPSAIYRYRKALDYFKKADLPNREISARLSLARMLMIDSSESAMRLLDSTLSMVVQCGDRLSGLSALELMTYGYDLETSGREVLNIISKVFSMYGPIPLTSTEGRIYRNLIASSASCYISLEMPDSAKLILEKMPVTDKVDSMWYYSIVSDIAKSDGDWRTVAESNEKAGRIQQEILEEGYEIQLAESEYRYDNAELKASLYKKEKEIFLYVLLAIILLGVVSILMRFMIKLLKKHRKDTARLRNALKSKASELERLKLEREQDESARIALEKMLRQQISSNKMLMGYYNLNYNAMKRLVQIFDLHETNPKYFLAKAVEIAEHLIKQTGSSGNTYTLIDTAYPGFLDKLFNEFPELKEEDKYLISLTCLGYPNRTVAYLLKISETNLSTKRTRLAQKMGLGKSLVKYLNERFCSYQSKPNNNS